MAYRKSATARQIAPLASSAGSDLSADMKLRNLGRAYDLPDDPFGGVAIDFWSDGSPEQRFVVIVSKAFADDHGWDRSSGLTAAVDQHVDEVLQRAQEEFDRGAYGLDLLA